MAARMQAEGSSRRGPENFFRELCGARYLAPHPIATPMRSILTRPPIPLALFHVRPMLGKANQGRFDGAISTHCVPMTFSGPSARITRIEEPCFVRLRSMDAISSRVSMGGA